jgi:hypothetical protein
MGLAECQGSVRNGVSSPSPVHFGHFRCKRRGIPASSADHMAKHQVVGRASRKGISHKIKRIAALAISRWPTVVDFVAVGATKIHKSHQVP